VAQKVHYRNKGESAIIYSIGERKGQGRGFEVQKSQLTVNRIGLGVKEEGEDNGAFTREQIRVFLTHAGLRDRRSPVTRDQSLGYASRKKWVQEPGRKRCKLLERSLFRLAGETISVVR